MSAKKITLNELKQLVKKVLMESEGKNITFERVGPGKYNVTYMYGEEGTIKGILEISHTQNGMQELFEPSSFSSEVLEEIYYNNEENIQETIFESFSEYMEDDSDEAEDENYEEDLEDDDSEDDDSDLVSYDIPEWALSSLINGDDSGIENEDIEKINSFVDDVVRKNGNANFLLGDMDGKDDLGFCRDNDIDSLGSNCYRVYIRPGKD